MNDLKRRPSLFISVALTALMLLAGPVTGLAEEQGGAVQTNGVISFYEESTPPNSTTEPTSGTTEPSVSASEVPVPSDTSSYPSTGTTTKPTGSYPSTGELVGASLGISGLILVALVLILFFYKRKREQDSAGKGGA